MKVLILNLAGDAVERVDMFPDMFGDGEGARPATLADFLHPEIVARSVVYSGLLAVDSGWGWNGTAPVPPPPRVEQPRNATRRKFLLACEALGIRTDLTAAATATTKLKDRLYFEDEPLLQDDNPGLNRLFNAAKAANPTGFGATTMKDVFDAACAL